MSCRTLSLLCRFQYAKYSLFACVSILFTCQTITAAPGQINNFETFKLVASQSEMSLRYIFDEYNKDSGSGTVTYQSRPTFEEEFSLATHSYMYHPDFLNMDISGGLLFVQQDFESDQGDSESSDTHHNFSGRFNFLRRKAYPITLYYQQSNPAATTSLAGRFLVKNTEYGMLASLNEPISPVSLSLEANSYKTQGSGVGTVIDSQIDKTIVRAYKPYGTSNSIRVSQVFSEKDSRSGSSGLAIQATQTEVKTTDINAINVFGSRNQFNLSQLFTYSDQTTSQAAVIADELSDIRYSIDLNVLHSEQTRSFYHYNILKSDRSLLVSNRQTVDTKNQSVNLGMSHGTDTGISADLGMHGTTEEQDINQFTRDTYGVRGSVNYDGEIPWGTFYAGFGATYDVSDQSSEQGLISVVDESITLTGSSAVTLLYDFVVHSTVVVQNQDKTQTYVENTDYQLISVGYTTQIQRIISGNIPDGDTVLVSYSYQTGGTVKYATEGYNYNVGVTLFKHVNAYARYSESTPELKEGNTTVPLNSIKNTVVGTRADFSFVTGWSLGGLLEYGDNDQTIAPSKRSTYNAYVQTQLPLASMIRFSVNKEKIDNLNSVEDNDNTQYQVHINSRPWLRTLLSISLIEEEDIGGSVVRRRSSQNMSLEWSVRKLRFSLRGEHIVDEQGSIEQERTLIRAQLTRRF